MVWNSLRTFLKSQRRKFTGKKRNTKKQTFALAFYISSEYFKKEMLIQTECFSSQFVKKEK